MRDWESPVNTNYEWTTTTGIRKHKPHRLKRNHPTSKSIHHKLGHLRRAIVWHIEDIRLMLDKREE